MKTASSGNTEEAVLILNDCVVIFTGHHTPQAINYLTELFLKNPTIFVFSGFVN